MIRTLLLSELSLDSSYEGFLRGDRPAPLPYGVEALESSGFRLRGAGRSVSPPWGKAREVVEHRVGFPVERAVRGVRVAARADLVLALLEREGFAAALARKHRIPPYSRTPVAIWSVWLAEDARRAGRERRSQLRRLVEGADLIAHASPDETETLVDLGVPEDKLLPFTFGVSHEYYLPGNAGRDISVLAVGQDRGRDFRTLVEAVRGTHVQVDLICRPSNIEGVDLPDNVHLHPPVSHAVYRRMLQRSRVVAVPTHELSYPTGSSVALEAASSGCAVVATDTPSLRRYLTDADNARLVPPGDVTRWREVLLELADDDDQRARLGRRARRSVVEHFNAHRMWTDFASVLLGRGIVTQPHHTAEQT